MRGVGWAVATIASVGVLACVSQAGAKTYEVTKRGDPAPNGCHKHDCSLREAIRTANAHPGRDRVVLPSRKSYDLSIANTLPEENEALRGDLDVTEAVHIEHPGKGRATIDANGVDRAFDMVSSASTTLRRLIITGGKPTSMLAGQGGGIRTADNLTLVRVIMRGNHAVGGEGAGGGISSSDGILRLRRSTLAHNRADDTSGAMDIGNTGVQIARSRLVHNQAPFAGVSYMYGVGHSRITKSTIAGNRSDSDAGGIYFSETDGSLRVVSSTLSGNRAAGDGGGLFGRNGTLTVINSTVAGNHADGAGGGVAGLATVSLNAVTVARNTAEAGGGLYDFQGSDEFAVENSLIAFNGAVGAGDDCGVEGTATFGSLGHNLLSTVADCPGFDDASDIVPANPMIGKLKANGGLTKTIALKRGSPAIGHAKKSSAPKRDQRGQKRDRRPDAGAFER
jgi:hypothetical protein